MFLLPQCGQLAFNTLIAIGDSVVICQMQKNITYVYIQIESCLCASARRPSTDSARQMWKLKRLSLLLLLCRIIAGMPVTRGIILSIDIVYAETCHVGFKTHGMKLYVNHRLWTKICNFEAKYVN